MNIYVYIERRGGEKRETVYWIVHKQLYAELSNMVGRRFKTWIYVAGNEFFKIWKNNYLI